MKVDFSKVIVKDINDKDVIVDATILGKIMYENAFLDEELELGKDIYFKKEIEINRPRAEAIKKYLVQLTAVARKGIIEMLDKAMKMEEAKTSKK